MPEWLYQSNPILDFSLAGLLLVALIWPRLGDAAFARIENSLTNFAAANKSLAILATALAAIVLRLSLWPLGICLPVPHVHDEMSYLLAADTFAHARLTNPAHPLWIFFDTIHVNQLPTYMSKYPPGQGAVLALGQILGHPWIGVLLSVAVLCAAIVWMLQGWMPSRWAFLGGALVLARYATGNYWVDSYWGGAVAAIGGALVIGALPRIFRRQKPLDAVLLGIGAAILAITRPFEGLFFFLPVGIALLIWFIKRAPSQKSSFKRVLAPLAAVLLLTAIFTGYYNRRLTNHALLFPYILNNKTYSTTPNFVWQNLQPTRAYANPQFDDYYNTWMHQIYEQTRFDALSSGLAHEYQSKIGPFRKYFLPVEFFLPILLTLPCLLRNRKFWAFFIPAASCFAAIATVVWFEPHYAAPLFARTNLHPRPRLPLPPPMELSRPPLRSRAHTRANPLFRSHDPIPHYPRPRGNQKRPQHPANGISPAISETTRQ